MARVIQPVFSTSLILTGGTSIVSTSWSVFHSGIEGPIKEIEVFNNTSQALYVATGNSGVEVQTKFTVFPNGNPSIPVVWPNNTRIALKAPTGTATAGYVIMNFYR